jgi:hypothetical protein
MHDTYNVVYNADETPYIIDVNPSDLDPSGGDIVVITGNNFSETIEDNTVTVDGVVWPIINASKTEL